MIIKTLLELDVVGKSRNFIKALERWKVKITCHKIRHNKLVTDIIESKIVGKSGRGKPKKVHFEDIKHFTQFGMHFNMNRTALKSRVTRFCLYSLIMLVPYKYFWTLNKKIIKQLFFKHKTVSN